MSKVTYTIHVELTDQGLFQVSVPKLPGCDFQADTFVEAIDRAKTSIERFLLTLRKAGKVIPMESQVTRPVCLPVQVNVPKPTNRLSPSKKS